MSATGNASVRCASSAASRTLFTGACHDSSGNEAAAGPARCASAVAAAGPPPPLAVYIAATRCAQSTIKRQASCSLRCGVVAGVSCWPRHSDTARRKRRSAIGRSGGACSRPASPVAEAAAELVPSSSPSERDRSLDVSLRATLDRVDTLSYPRRSSSLAVASESAVAPTATLDVVCCRFRRDGHTGCGASSQKPLHRTSSAAVAASTARVYSAHSSDVSRGGAPCLEGMREKIESRPRDVRYYGRQRQATAGNGRQRQATAAFPKQAQACGVSRLSHQFRFSR